MPRKPAKRPRGRPRSDVAMTERVLVRMDKPTRKALGQFSDKSGAGADATALRMIAVERLRAEGLL